MEILSELEQEDAKKLKNKRKRDERADEELEKVNAKIGQAEQIENAKRMQEGEQIQTLREERELAKQQRSRRKRAWLDKELRVRRRDSLNSARKVEELRR
ncbi:MAG: hypothetical protein ACLUFY_06700 [[Ruminococcus] torques]